MLGAILYKLGSFFSHTLPGGVPQAIARFIGEINWVFRIRTRRVIAHNQRLVLGANAPSREVRRAARRTILNFASCIQIFLELPWMRWEELSERVDLGGFIEAAGEVDGPFVMTTAHIGPWELGGYCMSRLGFPLNTVALDHPSPHVTRFFSERRAYLGIRAHPLEGSFHELVDALKRGEYVALLIDRAYGNARAAASLFGVERDFPLGHAVLAVRCDVPVLTGALVLDGRGGFRYVHGGTHRPDPGLPENERILKLHQDCLRDLEPIIREHHDQWFQFRRLVPQHRDGS
jgi:lauroyl/myristoyl acyltransferase